MSNAMKFCGCYHCRVGMRKGYGRYTVRYAKRKFRKQAKEDLRQGKEPDRLISVGYTD